MNVENKIVHITNGLVIDLRACGLNNPKEWSAIAVTMKSRTNHGVTYTGITGAVLTVKYDFRGVMYGTAKYKSCMETLETGLANVVKHKIDKLELVSTT